MNLILLEGDEVDFKSTVHLEDGRAAHITGVLNAQVGERVRIGRIDGPLGVGRVEARDSAGVTLTCEFDQDAPAALDVDLLLAMPRPKVLRRLWAQLAAIGVGRIMLTNAERVEADYFGAQALSEAVYRPLLIEGLQQARDTRLPRVSVHKRFKVLIEDELDACCPTETRIVAHPAVERSIGDAVSDASDQRVLLAIGPEGGWNTFELDLLRAHGFETAALGPRALRSDTACIAALALVHDALLTRSRST